MRNWLGSSERANCIQDSPCGPISVGDTADLIEFSSNSTYVTAAENVSGGVNSRGVSMENTPVREVRYLFVCEGWQSSIIDGMSGDIHFRSVLWDLLFYPHHFNRRLTFLIFCILDIVRSQNCCYAFPRDGCTIWFPNSMFC